MSRLQFGSCDPKDKYVDREMEGRWVGGGLEVGWRWVGGGLGEEGRGGGLEE